jgi:Co/Zn/Cd efflux system component
MLANLAFRRAVGFVALANLAYFGVEFAVAVRIHSVSLFADSVDFLEDTSVNCLIFFAVTWAAAMRARVGLVLAGLLLAPGLATLWTVAAKVAAPTPPDRVA